MTWNTVDLAALKARQLSSHPVQHGAKSNLPQRYIASQQKDGPDTARELCEGTGMGCGRAWPTMKGRSEKPQRAARREAPSQPPTRGTLDAAVSARVYAASAPAHACAAAQNRHLLQM